MSAADNSLGSSSALPLCSAVDRADRPRRHRRALSGERMLLGERRHGAGSRQPLVVGSVTRREVRGFDRSGAGGLQDSQRPRSGSDEGPGAMDCRDGASCRLHPARVPLAERSATDVASAGPNRRAVPQPVPTERKRTLLENGKSLLRAVSVAAGAGSPSLTCSGATGPPTSGLSRPASRVRPRRRCPHRTTGRVDRDAPLQRPGHVAKSRLDAVPATRW